MKHVMVDTETLATIPTAVVLTLGAVKFDPREDDRNGFDSKKELYLKLNIDQQIDDGRYVDDNTVKWWGQQSAIAQAEAFDDDGTRIDIKDGLRQFSAFFKGSRFIWSHGAAFDTPILEDLYRQYEIAIPWKFWDVRDTRTPFDMGVPSGMPKMTPHTALKDAKNQVIGVQNVFRGLNIK